MEGRGKVLETVFVAKCVLGDTIFAQVDKVCDGGVFDTKVSLDDGASHVETLGLVREALEAVPPVSAHHDGEFGARGGVLTLDGAAVEDDAQGALGVLLKGNRLRDEIAKAVDGEEVGVVVVEVDGHDGDKGREVGVAEGGDDDVVVLGRLVGVGLEGVSRAMGSWRAAIQ